MSVEVAEGARGFGGFRATIFSYGNLGALSQVFHASFLFL